jgi:hypothetical protein
MGVQRDHDAVHDGLGELAVGRAGEARRADPQRQREVPHGR